MSISPNIVAPTIPKIPMVSANFVRSKGGIPSRLSHTDAVSTVGAYGKEDFIYLDPPYVPENPQSFVKYTHDGFSLETHQELFQIVKQLHEKKRKLVLSNSNVPSVLNSFEEFSKEHLQVRRTINAKKPGSITTEVIIHNGTYGTLSSPR